MGDHWSHLFGCILRFKHCGECTEQRKSVLVIWLRKKEGNEERREPGS